MSEIVSSVAASLLSVPWMAVSPFSTFSRVMRPLIGARMFVRDSCHRASFRLASFWSTACCCAE